MVRHFAWMFTLTLVAAGCGDNPTIPPVNLDMGPKPIDLAQDQSIPQDLVRSTIVANTSAFSSSSARYCSQKWAHRDGS